jgi:hypothetical protein
MDRRPDESELGEGKLDPIEEGEVDEGKLGPIGVSEGELEPVVEGTPVLLKAVGSTSTGVVATSKVLENRNVDASSDISVPEVVGASPIPNGADSAQ